MMSTVILNCGEQLSAKPSGVGTTKFDLHWNGPVENVGKQSHGSCGNSPTVGAVKSPTLINWL